MKTIESYINKNEQINESVLAILTCLIGIPLLSHFAFKTEHKLNEKINHFWDWTFGDR